MFLPLQRGGAAVGSSPQRAGDVLLMAVSTAMPSVSVMFNQILAGYAGDPAGRDGVSLASRLSELSGAAVTVVFPYHPVLAAVSAEVAEQRARDELRALLGDDRLPDRARFRLSNESWPIRALHELSTREASDLIVFGAAPERFGRRHVGLMERMVHGAPCAVAVAPDGYAEDAGCSPIKRIGVGFVDNDEGRAAAQLAFELAQVSGEQLRILAASGLTGTLAAYVAMSAALPAVEQAMHAETLSAVEQLAGELSANGHVRREVRRGDPCRMLLDATRDLDLLVLGSRGYGPLRQVLLGSVSAGVMRHAHCPVLVLPRGSSRVSSEPAREAAAARG